jgi:hypothetical protein
LHSVVEVPRYEYLFAEPLQEFVPCLGVEIERVNDAVALDVLEERSLQGRRVVAVVKCTGAAEEVDVLSTFIIVDERVLRPREDLRIIP